MTGWLCHIWLQKELVWPNSKADLGACYHLLCTNLGQGILCTFCHTIIFTGVYQWWVTYALKPKTVSEMHFGANSKKTQSFRKNDCRQRCLDKILT